ncbi:hypothetical protein [Metabacillus sp. RGM 3146]|uniref:hypothetical protein n=1 Tax=Metabacillus sp. RGM 3146 TaxID=3401092 RepID=UPI003B98EBB3
MLELFFFILIAYTVCFAAFTLLFYLLHLSSHHQDAFIKATHDTVDLLIKIPLGWLITALYFIGLLLSFPIWLAKMSITRKPPSFPSKTKSAPNQKHPKIKG